MQVANVTAGYSDPATLGKRGEPIEPGGFRPPKLAEILGSPGGGAKTSAAAILAKYDVARITPTEFSEMLQKLYHAGALSDGEFQDLAGVRVDLEAAGAGPEERIDLREFYAEQVKRIQRKFSDADSQAARQQRLAPILRRLDWIEKFAVIQANPGAVGLDARA
jgi:hypothetical protein